MEMIFLGLVFLLALGVMFWFLNKKITDLVTTRQDDKAFLLLQQQMNQAMQSLERRLSETNQVLDKKLSESFQNTHRQFKESSQFMEGVGKQSREVLQEVSRQSQQMIREVTEKLTKLDETNRRVVEFSSQLKNLQDILKNPKQRGILGEYYLEETLKNVLPPNSYEMQYNLGKGNDGKDLIVDAVVKVKDKLIPVDSKFLWKIMSSCLIVLIRNCVKK